MKSFTIMTEHGIGRVSTVKADRYEIKDGYLKLLIDKVNGNITTACTVALFVPGEWRQLRVKDVTKQHHEISATDHGVDVYSELFHAWLKEHDKYETFMEAGHTSRTIIDEFNKFYEAMD